MSRFSNIKKTCLCVFLCVFIFLISLCACEKTDTEKKKAEAVKNRETVMPELRVEELPASSLQKIRELTPFDREENEAVQMTVRDATPLWYYGWKYEGGVGKGWELIEKDGDKRMDIQEPMIRDQKMQSISDDLFLQDRYRFKWYDEAEQAAKLNTQNYDEQVEIKLMRVDLHSGTQKEVASILLHDININMKKIDENRFLAYGLTRIPDETAEYALRSWAMIVPADGAPYTVIDETYTYIPGAENSDGIVLEQTDVYGESIFGFGRQTRSGKTECFLYEYNFNGNLLGKTELKGLSSLLKEDEPLHFYVRRDYVVFDTRTDTDLFILKAAKGKTELLFFVPDMRFSYAVAGDDIFVVKGNCDVYTGERTGDGCEAYHINTVSDEVQAYSFGAPGDLAYFSNIRAFSDGSAVLEFTSDSMYNLSEKQPNAQYVFSITTMQ